jgi:hypothetical protein
VVYDPIRNDLEMSAAIIVDVLVSRVTIPIQDEMMRRIHGSRSKLVEISSQLIRELIRFDGTQSRRCEFDSIWYFGFTGS